MVKGKKIYKHNTEKRCTNHTDQMYSKRRERGKLFKVLYTQDIIGSLKELSKELLLFMYAFSFFFYLE